MFIGNKSDDVGRVQVGRSRKMFIGRSRMMSEESKSEESRKMLSAGSSAMMATLGSLWERPLGFFQHLTCSATLGQCWKKPSGRSQKAPERGHHGTASSTEHLPTSSHLDSSDVFRLLPTLNIFQLLPTWTFSVSLICLLFM